MVSAKYQVFFSPDAADDLKKIPKDEAKKAVAYADRLAEHPFAGAAPLRHQTGEIWRKKLGRLRVMFTVDKDRRQVVIRVVDLRGDDTYKGLEGRLEWQPGGDDQPAID